MKLTARQLATILHALRKLQSPENCNYCCDHFDDVEQLSSRAIDALCEKLNSAE